MRHCPFCDKKCVNFGIKLDAEISIWMQSRFDGFGFSATLMGSATLHTQKDKLQVNRNTSEQKFFHISTVYLQSKKSPILQ